jgi:hypothetical protein
MYENLGLIVLGAALAAAAQWAWKKYGTTVLNKLFKKAE